MTCAAHSREIIPLVRAAPATRRQPGASGRSLLRRIFDAVFESRCKHAEREIAYYLERTGGRLTDNIEFRMTQRLITGCWDIRR